MQHLAGTFGGVGFATAAILCFPLRQKKTWMDRKEE